MMPVELRDVQSKKDRRTFVYLPERLHVGHRNWIPPIYLEEKKFFDPRKNPAFASSETKLVLAFRDDRPVGRIMGLINRRYNESRNERKARFGFLECPDDQDVAQALLSAVEEWALGKGMETLVGPMGFSDQDPEGFQVEGFEHPPTIATYCNAPYLPALVERAGYAKEVDYVVYEVDVTQDPPDFYRRIHDRVLRRGEFHPLEFTSRRALKGYIVPILRLMNDCFRDIYGYLPLTEKEMLDLGRRYLALIDPRFVKAVARGEEVTAFIIGIPNMADGLRRARGHLFPLGIFKILKAARRARQLDLLLGGVQEKHRGIGLDAVLGYRMLSEARRAGFVRIDSHHELESNLKVRAEMERLGGKIYKRFRIYGKPIGSANASEERKVP